MPCSADEVNKPSTAEQLSELVTSRIKQCPFERDGHKWDAASQEWRCEQLSISPATLRRLINKPPFVKGQAHLNGRRCTLLRIGQAGPKTARDYRNILSAMWRRHVGRRTSKLEFGCICGLVEVWPDGRAPQIFKLVLDNWDVFMAGAKIEATNPRYFKYPALRVLRRFAHVGPEMLAMQEQAKLAKMPTNQK